MDGLPVDQSYGVGPSRSSLQSALLKLQSSEILTEFGTQVLALQGEVDCGL